MKLVTIVTLGAAGLCAATAGVWFAVNPARPAAAAAPVVPTAPIAERTPPAPPPAPVDHSHFRTGDTLVVEGRVGHQVLPAAADSETFVYVDVTAADVAAARPAPLDLAIVIDRSGSMKGKRLANAMAATRTAIERLRDGDTVSIVTYDTEATVALAPTRIDATSRARVLRDLPRPRAGGDTCISCGLDAAMHQLGYRPGSVGRILLLSDGLATDGVRDVDGFRHIADDVRRLGASITTIGVDVGYDERVMAALARTSNGDHFFVPDATALPAIFDRAMATLTRAVADRAELIVDLAPGVTVDEVYDRVATTGSAQVVVPLGLFAAGEHKTALMRVHVPRGATGERAIAGVRVAFDDLTGDRRGHAEGALAVRASDDTTEAAPMDGLVSARVSASASAAALEAANELAREGRAADASALIARENARVAQAHEVARRNAAPAQQLAIDATFAVQKKALAGADEGFRPPPPPIAGASAPALATAPATMPVTAATGAAFATPPPTKPAKADHLARDRAAATQTRANQAEAFELGE